jgi:hypothetical protein
MTFSQRAGEAKPYLTGFIAGLTAWFVPPVVVPTFFVVLIGATVFYRGFVL